MHALHAFARLARDLFRGFRKRARARCLVSCRHERSRFVNRGLCRGKAKAATAQQRQQQGRRCILQHGRSVRSRIQQCGRDRAERPFFYEFVDAAVPAEVACPQGSGNVTDARNISRAAAGQKRAHNKRVLPLRCSVQCRRGPPLWQGPRLLQDSWLRSTDCNKIYFKI